MGSEMCIRDRNWVVAVERDSARRPRLFAIKATVDKLVNRASDGIPGFKDLSADIYFRDGKGNIVFDRQTVSADFPQLFNKALPPLELEGSIQLARKADQLAISSQSLKVGTLDVATDSAFQLQLLDNGSMPMLLNTSIDHVNMARLGDYYPEKVIQPGLHQWLTQAIGDGDVVRGSVSIDGDLQDFAPHVGKGRMFAEVDFVNSTVEFLSDWPAVTAMDGNITFDGTSLHGRAYKAVSYTHLTLPTIYSV